MSNSSYLYNVLYYSYLLPLVLVAVLLLSKNYSKNLNFIVLLCISSFSCEFLSDYTNSHKVNNMFLSHIGQSFDFIILIGIFSSSVIKPKAKMASFFILDTVIAFCIYYGFSISLQRDPVYASLLIGITVICLVIYFFFEIFRYEHIEDLSVNPVFWIKSTYLLYFSGTFAYHGLSESLASGVMGENVWIVNWILIIVCNLVFTLAIWLGRVRKT